MPAEIERKFLIIGDGWRHLAMRRRVIRQGYLTRGEPSVRIRVIDDSQAVVTIKSADSGITRNEFEYEVPLADAADLLGMCGDSLIEKTRHDIPAGTVTWEIDEFAGRNAGLVIAEIELESEAQAFDKPEWLGAEVTGDERYSNASLSVRPSTTW